MNSASVICHGFRVNCDTVHFGTVELESILEGRDQFMYPIHGQIVGKRAMAGQRDVFAHTPDHDLVHIDNLRIMARGIPKRFFDPAVLFDQLLRLFDGGRLALNVREDGINLGVSRLISASRLLTKLCASSSFIFSSSSTCSSTCSLP